MIFLLPVACSSSRALTPLATNPVQCACVSLQCVAGRRTCWTPTSQGPQWPASGQIMSDVCNTALIKMRACFSACALYVCCRDLDLLEFNQPRASMTSSSLAPYSPASSTASPTAPPIAPPTVSPHLLLRLCDCLTLCSVRVLQGPGSAGVQPAKGLNDQLQFGALLSRLLYCIPYYCASYCASYRVSTFVQGNHNDSMHARSGDQGLALAVQSGIHIDYVIFRHYTVSDAILAFTIYTPLR